MYNELIFMMDVPAGSIFTARQIVNDYDSMHETRWGGDCPGDNVMQCTDDSDESGTEAQTRRTRILS